MQKMPTPNIVAELEERKPSLLSISTHDGTISNLYNPRMIIHIVIMQKHITHEQKKRLLKRAAA